jgi:spore maturation protein CgeB
MSTILFVAPASDYSQQVASTLASMGHRVVPIDERTDYGLPRVVRTWRWLWRPTRRISFLRRRSNHALQRVILDCASRELPDLLLATKGMNVEPETLATMRQADVRTAVWFPDNAANEPYASWVRTVGVLWDHFFSFDPAIYGQMPKDAHARVHVLAFGVDPSRYENISLNDEDRARYACDVCFVGAPYPERVRLLEQIQDLNVKVWGWSGWSATPLRSRYFGSLDARESAKVYRLAKICINTNVHPLAKGVNLKTFEIAAAGGFELTDHPEHLEESFVVGKELDTFEGENEFRSKVEYWLTHEQERAMVAEAGRARTLRDHTLQQRLRVLLNTVGL